MKKALILVLAVLMCISFCACGKKQTTETNESLIPPSEPIESPSAPNKPLVVQVNEQLTGTWISYDSDDMMSKWTFFNGNYVVDTYINGEKIDNSVVGTYAIGVDSIHTFTIDQKNNVEGHIPFTFIDGNLQLHGATGDIQKER